MVGMGIAYRFLVGLAWIMAMSSCGRTPLDFSSNPGDLSVSNEPGGTGGSAGAQGTVAVAGGSSTGGATNMPAHTGGFAAGGAASSTGGVSVTYCNSSTTVALPTGGALGSAPVSCPGMLTFGGAPILATGYAVDVAAADLNGDNKPDLVFANLSTATVGVLLGEGDGTFAAAVDYSTAEPPRAVIIADLNADGRPDLAVVNYKASSVGVLLGKGDGTFAAHVDYPTSASPNSVVAGDLNGDGTLDLVVPSGSDSGVVSVLLGHGDGKFAPHVDYATDEIPNSAAIGDFNGDGTPDVLAVHFPDSAEDPPLVAVSGKDGSLLWTASESASPPARDSNLSANVPSPLPSSTLAVPSISATAISRRPSLSKSATLTDLGYSSVR